MSKKKKQENNKRRVNDYMRFSTLGLQMAGIIFLSLMGGRYLDKQLELSFPALTLIGAGLGLGAAMYFLIKETSKKP